MVQGRSADHPRHRARGHRVLVCPRLPLRGARHEASRRLLREPGRAAHRRRPPLQLPLHRVHPVRPCGPPDSRACHPPPAGTGMFNPRAPGTRRASRPQLVPADGPARIAAACVAFSWLRSSCMMCCQEQRGAPEPGVFVGGGASRCRERLAARRWPPWHAGPGFRSTSSFQECVRELVARASGYGGAAPRVWCTSVGPPCVARQFRRQFRTRLPAGRASARCCGDVCCCGDSSDSARCCVD